MRKSIMPGETQDFIPHRIHLQRFSFVICQGQADTGKRDRITEYGFISLFTRLPLGQYGFVVSTANRQFIVGKILL